jgi:septal ring-binding cell division protein DamX
MSGFLDRPAPSPEIFFRAVDRLQLESYLSALKQNNRSLVLVSDHKALLDYYGELVVKRIQQEFPETKLEVFVSQDTEGLLERFNAILNNLSFSVATSPPPAGRPDTIWLIQNAHAMAEKDLQILLKLIENFPGAGISTLLIFDSSSHGNSSFFSNSRINTWALTMPTPEQKASALKQARQNGLEDIANELLNQLAPSERKSTPTPTPTPALSQTPSPKAGQTPKAGKPKKILPWLIICGGLLAISIGVSAVLHPEFGEKILTLFTPSKSKNLTVVQAEDLSTKSENTEKSAIASAMPSLALKGLQWLTELPDEQYVIEFQTFETVEDAQKEIESKDWLKRSYVVPVRSEGSSDIKYLIVDGPFRTADMAKKAASRMPNANDIVIENIAGLRGYAGPAKTQP